MPVDPATRKDVDKWLAARAEETRRYRVERALQNLYMPRLPSAEVANNDLPALYDFAATQIGRDSAVLYLEFGVAGGLSMSRMVERFTHANARFIGFDSFEGLPEDWVQPWGVTSRGAFSTGGMPPDLRNERVSFVKGWFQNTLPPFLDDYDFQRFPKVLVHFDADLYSSTLFILATLWSHIPEYYFIFDEFMDEEIIALDDFARAFPIELRFLCQTNAGSYPNQIFGHLKRVPLVL